MLTEPILTDYAPAVKPPWAILAFTFCLLALATPREVLPEFGLAAVVVVVGGLLLNPCFNRPANPGGDATDGTP